GALVWGKYQGEGESQGTSIGVDTSGNVFVSLEYSLGVGVVEKLDRDGVGQWATQLGTSSTIPTAVVVDSAGHVYSTGYFVESSVFGDRVLTSRGECEMFLTKLNSATGSFEATQ